MSSVIPRSRLSRATALGGTAATIAGRVFLKSARGMLTGQSHALGDLLLDASNATLLMAQLSRMRGAAMKLGQLISMDAGFLLPPAFAEVFARLRNQADYMPMTDVAEVLTAEFGANWQKDFRRFHFQPVASASIGQVHRAELADGTAVAVKIQYPGVRDSIDSDLDNVHRLLKMFRLLPADVDLTRLLDEARYQLRLETDYRHEARISREFSRLLAGDARYQAAEVMGGLSGESVLTTAFCDGVPVDTLHDADAELRQQVAGDLLELAMREVFEFGLVQTDANFANFLYSNSQQTLQLLDFGAARTYSAATRDALRQLMLACIQADETLIARQAIAVGYLNANDRASTQQAIVDLLLTATTPLRHDGAYNFSDTSLSEQMMQKLVELRGRQDYLQLPPAEILFLHRKLGGMYLLLARLGVALNVRQLVDKLTH